MVTFVFVIRATASLLPRYTGDARGDYVYDVVDQPVGRVCMQHASFQSLV